MSQTLTIIADQETERHNHEIASLFQHIQLQICKLLQTVKVDEHRHWVSNTYPEDANFIREIITHYWVACLYNENGRFTITLYLDEGSFTSFGCSLTCKLLRFIYRSLAMSDCSEMLDESFITDFFSVEDQGRYWGFVKGKQDESFSIYKEDFIIT